MPPKLVKTEVRASRELVPHGQNKSPMRMTFKTAATMLALGLLWDIALISLCEIFRQTRDFSEPIYTRYADSNFLFYLV